MQGTSAFLRLDQRISVYDCLHGLLLPSGNDAAVVLATSFGKWLYFSSNKKQNPARISTNNSESPTPFQFEWNHEEYIAAFVSEMNK